MSDLTALREVAAASPSLDHLGAAHTVARKSPRGGRSSSAIIAPRPLSASGASPSATGAASPYRNGPARRAVSAGMSGARRSIQSGASTSAGGASSTRHGANARPSSAQNWEPKVDSYVQDSRMAYNPPEVAKRLLTAECPTEVQERLVNASSRLAQDPSMLKSLIKGKHAASSKQQTPRLARPGSAASALTLGTEPSIEWEDDEDEEDSYAAEDAASLAAEKIGRDIHLSRPATGYQHPHSGNVHPLAESISSLWDRELPRSLRKPPEELAQTPPSVPRPVAILNTENEMRALTAAEMQRLGIRPHEAAKLEQKAQQNGKFLKVVMTMREKEPEAVFTFKEYSSAGKSAPIIVFEHIDGCKFCEQLYGHFLMPNGKLAHFYARDNHLRRGRFVALAEPPVPALSLTDLLQPSFLAPPVFTNDLKHPGRPYNEFVKLFGLPLPTLAPRRSTPTLRVRRADPGDNRFPAGWRLDQGTGMSFTATPIRANRLDTLSVPLADDMPPGGLNLAESVWAPRATESDARAFFDSPAVVKEQAEKDWSQIDRCAGFKLWLDRAVPGGYQAQAPALQAALLSVFDALKQTFHYFCITGAGSPFLLSQKEYARFLLDAGVAQAEHPLLTKPKCLAFFKDTVAHCRIPQYLPKEIKPKRKRKKKAAEGGAKPAPAVRRKEAPKEPEAELVRPEFLQVVIRLAIYMFGSRPSADPETPEAWELDPGMDAGQCLQRFVHEVMASRLPKSAFINPNEFRFKRLYTKEVDAVLRGDFTCPAAELLQLLYARQSVRRRTEAAEVSAMTMVTWLELLDTCGLIGASTMGLQISLVDARACFMMAKMSVPNDTQHHLRWESATLCEFMEALARAADCISWPEEEVLRAKGGFSCLYEYLKKDPKARPRLPRRPSFGMDAPASRPLAPKLRELLSLLFQVLAEMTILSPARLIARLKKDLKRSAFRAREYTTDYAPGQATAGLNYSNPPGKKRPPPPLQAETTAAPPLAPASAAEAEAAPSKTASKATTAAAATPTTTAPEAAGAATPPAAAAAAAAVAAAPSGGGGGDAAAGGASEPPPTDPSPPEQPPAAVEPTAAAGVAPVFTG